MNVYPPHISTTPLNQEYRSERTIANVRSVVLAAHAVEQNSHRPSRDLIIGNVAFDESLHEEVDLSFELTPRDPRFG